jgi:hypothetical protein
MAVMGQQMHHALLNALKFVDLGPGQWVQLFPKTL